MKKLFLFFCVVMMFFGITGCLSDDSASMLSKSNNSLKSVTTPETVSSTKANDVSPVPEPATLILIGSGLVGLAAFGRKKYKK